MHTKHYIEKSQQNIQKIIINLFFIRSPLARLNIVTINFLEALMDFTMALYSFLWINITFI